MKDQKQKLPTETTLDVDEAFLMAEIAESGSIESSLDALQSRLEGRWLTEVQDPFVKEQLKPLSKKKTKQIAASLADKLRILARGLK